MTNSAIPAANRAAAVRPLLAAITDRCPIACGHCGLAEKNSADFPAPQVILRRLEGALRYGFNHLVFTGGEPFADLDLLRQALQCCQRGRVTAGVFTNAFWAESEAQARRVLDSLPGLSHLWVSVDRHHLNYVPLQKVRWAIEAARSCHLQDVCLVVSAGTVQERLDMKDLLRQHGLGERVFFNPIIPAPFMPSTVDLESWKIGGLGPESPLGPCRINTPLVFLDGTLAMCHIGKTFSAAGDHGAPYRLGNVDAEGWEILMARALANPLYLFLSRHGPWGLLELLAPSPSRERLAAAEVTCACHLCICLLADREFRDEVLTVLNSPGWRALLEISRYLPREGARPQTDLGACPG
ncbi:radical SAM protein [Trichloromonas sp.]|uniref:radical SAM protein n=1 Tax=Trichloromonas sp. TaxID=3069249 RepID=UPI003D819AAE